MERALVIVLVGVGVISGAQLVVAQDRSERFVVLRTVAGSEAEGMFAAAEHVEHAASEGRTMLTAQQTAELVGQRHSSEPAAASQDDFDVLARESDEALEHVAFGRRRQARRAIESILERAEGAIEALNRESRSARRVLNSCLYLVRALADARDEEAALSQAIECARLVPDMRPSAAEHPPEVRQFYERAVERIESGPHGSLQVDSSPSGCAVYLNGRRLGSTPFTRSQLPTGEYRVQVECTRGRPGRVHRLILAAEPREVIINSRFDRTLRSTASDVRLEYANTGDEDAYRLEDAATLAEILGASDVLLVSAEGAEVTRVDWITMPDRVVASTRIAMTAAGASHESLERGVRALLAGRSVDATADDVEMETWSPPRSGEAAGAAPSSGLSQADESGASAGPDLSLLGWVLGGVGIATYGVAWGLWGEWSRRDGQVDIAEPTDPDYQDRIARRDALVLPVALLGAGGAILTTAALPLVIGEDGAAWWHWVLGGAGVAVLSVGIGLWTQEGTCNDTLCSERNRTVPLAPLLATMSVPLIAVPIVALLMDSGEDAPASDLTIWPTFGPDGAGLVIGGTL